MRTISDIISSEMERSGGQKNALKLEENEKYENVADYHFWRLPGAAFSSFPGDDVLPLPFHLLPPSQSLTLSFICDLFYFFTFFFFLTPPFFFTLPPTLPTSKLSECREPPSLLRLNGGIWHCSLPLGFFFSPFCFSSLSIPLSYPLSPFSPCFLFISKSTHVYAPNLLHFVILHVKAVSSALGLMCTGSPPTCSEGEEVEVGELGNMGVVRRV